MARQVVGVDIGADAIHVVSGRDRKGIFTVRAVVRVPRPDDGDEAAWAEAFAEALADAGVRGEAICGLTGRDVVIRYTQVPPVPDWQLRQLMDFEIRELAEQAGEEELAADFNLIPVASDVTSDDTVLLALAKRAILEHHLALLAGTRLDVRAFSPNAIALFNAYRKVGHGEGTVLLLDIGARNTDIAIARDDDLLFARNVSGGGNLFDEALAAALKVSERKARRLKEELADVGPSGGERRSAQVEKVSRALAGATGQILSMVESSVRFARTQIGVRELSLDRVLLCGGGSRLRGLDRYLAANLGVPVERFDPFDGVDASAVEDVLDEDERTSSVVALGLAFQAAYDDCYSIEILPQELKRKREFRERTIYVLLSALLALLYLGYDAVQSRSDAKAAQLDSMRYRNEMRKRERALEEYRAALEARDEAAARLDLLERWVVRGLSVDRVLPLLQRHLPQDLYVTSIALTETTDEELGIVGDARPVVEVKGEGREGAEGLEQTFNRFVQDLAADPLVPRLPRSRTSPAGPRKPFEWTLTLNFSHPSDPADGAEAADGSP